MRHSLANSVTARGTFAGKVFEFRLEPLQQGERIGRRTGKTGNHLAVHEPADLNGIGFDDRTSDRDLTVTPKATVP